jgi:hypothetical protein
MTVVLPTWIRVMFAAPRRPSAIGVMTPPGVI